ncbi:hypothetical protein SAMN05216237_4450 [Pseudomonas yamanorum]|nr:hypothetical protein SAMN05216237_4450 [Pseudomonas yamanorum]
MDLCRGWNTTNGKNSISTQARPHSNPSRDLLNGNCHFFYKVRPIVAIWYPKNYPSFPSRPHEWILTHFISQACIRTMPRHHNRRLIQGVEPLLDRTHDGGLVTAP